MQNDYEILGLSKDASQDEIKRAYFKLVRKFSPEKDPERFQEIRGAYERLVQAADIQKKMFNLKLDMPDDPEAKDMFNAINLLMGQRQYKKASSESKRAIDTFGEYEAFLYLFAVSQRLGGHSGNAIKYYKKLTEQYPDRNLYKRGLAFSYYDRGYLTKAFDAFEDAYKLGMRDADFILQFSSCCYDRGSYDRGSEILIELVKKFDITVKEQSQDYLEAYIALFAMSIFQSGDYLNDLVKLYANFIKIAGKTLKNYDEGAFEIATVIIVNMANSDTMPYINQILEETEKIFPKEKYPDQWEIILSYLNIAKLEADARLSEEIKWCWEAFITSCDMFEDSVTRFIQLDSKLSIIECLPEIMEEFEIVKNEYPELYTEMEEFLTQLETEDISYLKRNC